MNTKAGLICKLTGEKADFENECKSFQLDEAVIARMDDREALEHKDVLGKLSEKSIAKFKSEQDYPKALIAAIIVGILGAMVWGAITVYTGLQLGIVAVGDGAAVGFSMRVVGKGIDQIFGITGGVIALLSCLLGNFLGTIGFIAKSERLGYFETLNLFDYGQILPSMIETSTLMVILFYGIGAFVGYKLSFRKFTEKEIYELGE